MSERPTADYDATHGCDCETCSAGEDRWCCRTCHDLARVIPPEVTEDPA